MKRLLSAILIGIMIIALVGCSDQQAVTPSASPAPYTEQRQGYYDVTLYYPNASSDSVLASSQKVKKTSDQSIYMDIMDALLDQDGENRSNFSYAFDSDVVCRSIVQQQNILYINFSWRLMEMTADQIFAAIVVLVNTYTQFNDIEFINISVEGKQLTMPDFPERPLWLFSRFNDDVVDLKEQAALLKTQYTTDKSAMEERKYAILYFNIPDTAYLIPEVRPVDVLGSDYAGKIIDELLSGPRNTTLAQASLPSGFQLYEEIAFDESTKTLRLSFVADTTWEIPTGEWSALPSLVNSLTHAVPEMETLSVSIFQSNDTLLERVYTASVSVSDYGGSIRSRISMYVPDENVTYLEKSSAIVEYMPDEDSYPEIMAQLLKRLSAVLPFTEGDTTEEEYAGMIHTVYTNSDTVIIDISDALYQQFSKLNTKEEFLAVYSIVATMCEATQTNKAQILVDGKKRQHFVSSVAIFGTLLNVPTDQLNQYAAD